MFCTYICIIIIIILILCVIIIKAFTINWAKNGCSENGKREREPYTIERLYYYIWISSSNLISPDIIIIFNITQCDVLTYIQH